MTALLDTNILIDYLNAVPEAAAEIRRYDEPSISVVTFVEVLVGTPSPFEAGTRAFLAGFRVILLDDDIVERTILLRRERRIKLPDAVILATADTRSLLLVTRNKRDFPESMPNVRIPY